MTREEELWAAIVAALKNEGYTGEVPSAPAWRREEFLVGILGAIKGVEGAAVPEPVWREEQYLKAMFDELSSGGGGSSYKLLKSAEFTVNTSSTAAIDVGTVAAGSAAFDSSKILYVRIRDKAGVRDGYFTESDSWFPNPYQSKGQTVSFSTCGKFSIGKWSVSSSQYGVYPYNIGSDGTVTIKAKYSSAYGTIDGTYVVEVYALDWPDKVSPFVTVS